jgi:hypothetical protein
MSYEATTSASGVNQRLTVSQIRYAGVQDGVLYRQIFLGPPKGHHSEGILIDLADLAVPGGLLRVDRVRASFPYTLWLGGFAVPGHQPLSKTSRAGRTIYELVTKQDQKTLVSSMIPLLGWHKPAIAHRTGTHAEYPTSTCLGLSRSTDAANSSSIAILSALVTSKSVSDDDIPTVLPHSTDYGSTGSGAVIEFASGLRIVVSFDAIEGKLAE